MQRSPGASSASDSGANMRRLLHQSDAVPSGSNVTGGSDPQGPVAKFATQNDEGDPFFVGGTVLFPKVCSRLNKDRSIQGR